MLQLVSTYAAVFGSPGGTRPDGDPRVRALVDSTTSAFCSAAQWGLAAHAAQAAVHSAPEHLAGALVAEQPSGSTIAFQGDFGVAELAPALQYLQSTAEQHAAGLHAPELVTEVEAVASGAWRCGPSSLRGRPVNLGESHAGARPSHDLGDAQHQLRRCWKLCVVKRRWGACLSQCP